LDPSLSTFSSDMDFDSNNVEIMCFSLTMNRLFAIHTLIQANGIFPNINFREKWFFGKSCQSKVIPLDMTNNLRHFLKLWLFLRNFYFCFLLFKWNFSFHSSFLIFLKEFSFISSFWHKFRFGNNEKSLSLGDAGNRFL
jgi:hypothetical protein